MTTLRQIEANLRNSAKSTGPKSETGKAASRANSLKHGLTGAGIVMPHEEIEAVNVRMTAWRPSYQPATSEDEWLFREMVTQTVRIDRCHRDEAALRAQIALRAGLCWDDDRRHDAETLGDKIAKKPARTIHQLTRTKQGCEWMIGRWNALDNILESHGEWTEAQRSLALDLLGTPLELRDPTDNFGSSDDAPEARATIRAQIERLKTLKTDALDSLDDFEREAAEKGIELQTPRPLAQLRRYEAACLHRFHSARNQLRTSVGQPSPSEFLYSSTFASIPTPPIPTSPVEPPFRFEPEPEPEPEPQPEPEPEPEPKLVTEPLPLLGLSPAPSFSRAMMTPAPMMNRRQRLVAEKFASDH